MKDSIFSHPSSRKYVVFSIFCTALLYRAISPLTILLNRPAAPDFPFRWKPREAGIGVHFPRAEDRLYGFPVVTAVISIAAAVLHP